MLKWQRVGGGFGVLAVAALILYLVCLQSVHPGHVGVLVDYPVFGSVGGVRKDVIQPGRTAIWPTTTLVEVSTAPWTVKVHIDDMMSKNKVPLDFDIAITFEMEGQSAASDLVKKFNSGPVTAFRRIMMPGLDPETLVAVNPSGEFMSFIRDQVRDYHMDEFMIAVNAAGGHSDAIKDVEGRASAHMNKFFKEAGVPLKVTNVAMGRANPPDEVKGAMARTAEQVQMQTTEKERTHAQHERKAAEIASAEADKAQQEKLGFDNNQYLKMLELQTIEKVCGSKKKELKDVGGSSGCTIIWGAAATPVIPVGTSR